MITYPEGRVRFEYGCPEGHRFDAFPPDPILSLQCECGLIAHRRFTVPRLGAIQIEPYFHRGLGTVVYSRSDIARGIDKLNEENPGSNFVEMPDLDAHAPPGSGIEYKGSTMTHSLTKEEYGDDPDGIFGKPEGASNPVLESGWSDDDD